MKNKPIYGCKRCGHNWIAKKINPVRCPRCQSVKWNGDWKKKE